MKAMETFIIPLENSHGARGCDTSLSQSQPASSSASQILYVYLLNKTITIQVSSSNG